MKDFIRQNSVFIVHCLVFLCGLGAALCLIPKAELHLALNSFHTPAGDIFFRYFTYIGDYGPYILFVLLLFYRLGAGTYVVASNLLAGLVTQIIKHIVQAPRPATFFDIAHNPDILPIVDGVKMHAYNSFPSGHTTTCFAIFFALSIILSNKELHLSDAARTTCQYFCFVLAVLGGYSRIYLSQHFAADIFAGAIVALCITAALYPLFGYWKKRHPASYDWRIQQLISPN